MPTSYETLKKRYTDEKFLLNAAKRREALEYQKISFGKLSGKKRYILLLLKDTHNSFYIGNYPATVALCGMMLESMLLLKIKIHFAVTKTIEYKRSPKSPVTTIKNEADLVSLTFVDLIGVCHFYTYLPNDLFQDLRNIHKIRNMTIHEKMPFFKRVEDEYQLELQGAKFPVVIKRDDVKPLWSETASLAAYYCLTKTRLIFHKLIATIEED
jgi:hypothetical protein